MSIQWEVFGKVLEKMLIICVGMLWLYPYQEVYLKVQHKARPYHHLVDAGVLCSCSLIEWTAKTFIILKKDDQ
eukprot:627670-Ditylum_brightwellii.AAC.2